jgi:hypothetical protein
MKIALTLTILSMALAIFSMWFFVANGVSLAGLILGTGFIIQGMLFGFITFLLYKESK